MISMQDVAKAASVSELLYRRFSINILMLVTRQKAQMTIERLNYQPNLLGEI